MIQPIVEGHGEVTAVPELLRRLIGDLGIYHVEVRRPIRRKRHELLSEERFRESIQLACLEPEVGAIFVIFDLDDDCARDLVPNLLAWGVEEAASRAFGLALARREYEAWLLAGVDSLRGQRGISSGATYPGDPEAIRDAKGILRHYMPANQSYVETTDQAAFSARFDMRQAYRRASSFRKLVKEICRVLTELGCQPAVPPEWLA